MAISIQGTFRQLMNYENQIRLWEDGSSILVIFHSTKIIQFRQANTIWLNRIGEVTEKMYDKYCKKDETGKVIMKKSGYPEFNTPEDEDSYNKEINEFLDQRLAIRF